MNNNYYNNGINGSGNNFANNSFMPTNQQFQFQSNGMQQQANFNSQQSTPPLPVTNQYNTDFDGQSRITHPTDRIDVPEHILTIDSRQRNYAKYPSPSLYTIDIGDQFRNIDTIELKNSLVQRAMYNVHNTNKYIDFSIGDTVTSIVYKGPKIVYSAPPTVTISPPTISGGTQATATAILGSDGTIASINVTNPGSGYYRSIGAQLIVDGLAVNADVSIGTLYTAVLRNGQYTIGGNPSSASVGPDLLVGTGLIKEIQDAMNYAVNGGAYVSGSSSPFQVRLVSQYPVLDPVAGSPEAAQTNATKFNRIQITNVTDGGGQPWELLFGSGPNKGLSASKVLGFASKDVYQPVDTVAVSIGGDEVTSAGSSLRSVFDYDLQDDPKYIILTITGSYKDGSDPFHRQTSENASLNRTFASIVFDANTPNVIIDTTGTTTTDGYLDGLVTKGTFWFPSGNLRAVRGFDADQKKLKLYAAQGRLQNITIKWTQFVPNGEPEQLYDFSDRDHMLIFSVKGTDNQSGRKW